MKEGCIPLTEFDKMTNRRIQRLLAQQEERLKQQQEYMERERKKQEKEMNRMTK